MHRSHRTHRLVLLTSVALIAALAAPAAALAQCPQTTLAEVENEVMCPVCGTPLALATEVPQAQEQRQFIVERVERCESKEEIKAALVAEFGESVLATPGGDGFDLLGYVLPALAVLAGASALGLAAFRWRRGRMAPLATRDHADGTDDARLEEDLKRYDL